MIDAREYDSIEDLAKAMELDYRRQMQQTINAISRDIQICAHTIQNYSGTAFEDACSNMDKHYIYSTALDIERVAADLCVKARRIRDVSRYIPDTNKD